MEWHEEIDKIHEDIGVTSETFEWSKKQFNEYLSKKNICDYVKNAHLKEFTGRITISGETITYLKNPKQ